jgi:hypothetical protein
MYLQLAFEFINRKVNYVIAFLIIGILFLSSLIDFITYDIKPPIDEIILKTNLGSVVLFFAFQLVLNISRLFRLKILPNLLINGYSKTDVFRILLSQCFIFSVISGLSYLIAIGLFSGLTKEVGLGNFSFGTLYKYFIASLFYNSFILIIYLLIRNSYLSMLLFLGTIFLDRVAKRFYFTDKEVLPFDWLFTYIQKDEYAVAPVLFSALFFLISYLLIKGKKRWV